MARHRDSSGDSKAMAQTQQIFIILLISSTLIFGVITGFVSLSDGELLCGVAGQVAHALLSILCFALVGITFWRFGWILGLIDLALVVVASKVGLGLCRYLRKRSGL